jgi:hypothetical protein
MMAVPILRPTYMFGDNLSVITNTSKPKSTLRKKSNSICYHAVQESAAMGEVMMAWEPSLTNPANIATKVLPGGRRRQEIVGLILYDA